MWGYVKHTIRGHQQEKPPSKIIATYQTRKLSV